jgi:hypothetical protein
MRLAKTLVQSSMILSVLTLGTHAFAQESEFQNKMQEDLDYYQKYFASNCGGSEKVTVKWSGKLGFNPREIKEGDYTAVSTLATSGLDGVVMNGCQNNAVVKKAISKVTTVVCQRGTGTLSYTLKGSTLTIMVDPSYKKNNAAGQESDFVEKLKKDLDK